MRIKEAIYLAKSNGYDPDKMADEIWPESTEKTRSANYFRLVNGHTTRINPEWIEIICRYTGVDANYLFNLTPMR